MTRRVRVPILAGLSLLALVGCGPDRGPQSWIGERSAVLRCTSSGPTRMPPVLFGVPAPPPPTGLYARAIDPLALDELGYERDRVACAILEAPTPEQVEATQAALEQFAATRASASKAAISAGGRCTCEVARSLGVRALVDGCLGVPAKPGCDTQRNRDELELAMKPVVEALPTVPLPLRHWRLVGPADRDGWFADKYMDLLDRHTGGSTVYLAGQPVPTYDNGPFISRMFEIPDVVAVVQQDAGRSLLLVRESGSDLILDHFTYPRAIPLSLVKFLDEANPDAYEALLGKPDSTRDPLLDVGKGNIVEFDPALLEHVDAMAIAGTALLGTPYSVDAESRSAPDAFVERVAFQAPFGREGQELVAYAQLSEAGKAWAQGVTDDRLTPTLDQLGLAGEPATFSGAAQPQLSFLGRGTPTEFAGVHGLRRVPEVFAAIERAHPGTIQGTATAWEFQMPRSELTDLVGPHKVFEGLRQLFAQKDYVVTLSFEKNREAIALRAKPR